MAGRDTVGRQDSTAHPGTMSRSGATAWQDDVASVTDDGRVHRHCQGAMAYLKNLADELHARGLMARVIRARSGVAFVRVVNPVATAMRENVTCAPSPAACTIGTTGGRGGNACTASMTRPGRPRRSLMSWTPWWRRPGSPGSAPRAVLLGARSSSRCRCVRADGAGRPARADGAGRPARADGAGGLRGPMARAGLRGPMARAGLRGPMARAGLRGPMARAGVRGHAAIGQYEGSARRRDHRSAASKTEHYRVRPQPTGPSLPRYGRNRGDPARAGSARRQWHG